MKRYRGRINSTQKDILKWMLKNLVLISKEKILSEGKERFMEDTEFLIPWSPRDSFNIDNKNHMSKISTSLRLLEQRGYIKRHRNTPKGPVAYVAFTNDGIFIAKTWARITESNEEDIIKILMTLKKGLKGKIQIVTTNGTKGMKYNYLFSIKCFN